MSLKNFALNQSTFYSNYQDGGDCLYIYFGKYEPKAFSRYAHARVGKIQKRFYLIDDNGNVTRYHPIRGLEFYSPCNSYLPVAGFYFILEKQAKLYSKSHVSPIPKLPCAVDY